MRRRAFLAAIGLAPFARLRRTKATRTERVGLPEAFAYSVGQRVTRTGVGRYDFAMDPAARAPVMTIAHVDYNSGVVTVSCS